MPDIGALNIRISSESTQAEQGLIKVADALGRIKNALANAGLGNVASALNRINKAINGFRVDGTIENLNGLAAALKRVQEASNFKAPDLKGVQNIQKSVNSVAQVNETTAQINDAVGKTAEDTASGFQEIASTISEAQESVDNFSEGMSKVDTGAEQAEEAYRQAFENIVNQNKSAAEAAAKIRAEQEKAFYAGDRTGGPKSMAETDALSDTLTKLDLLKAQLRDAEQEYNKFVNTLGESDTRSIKAGLKVSDLKDKIWEYSNPKGAEEPTQVASSIQRATQNANGLQTALDGASGAASRLTEHIGNTGMKASEAYSRVTDFRTAMNNMEHGGPVADVEKLLGMDKIDMLEAKINGLKAALAEGIGSGKLSDLQVVAKVAEIQRLIDKLREAKEEEQKLMFGSVDGEFNTFGQSMSNAGENAVGLNDKLKDVDREMKSKKKDANSAGSAFEGLKKSTGSLGKAVDRLSRMFSTMVMRMALKSLIKSLKSSWEAMYNFSKASNGEFAQSVDRIKGLFAASATNILKTFAPAIEALVPVVNVVAVAIQYLCNMIQQLLSLLGMSSSLWNASADSINKYSKAAGGGSSKTKEILASFDELNVISKQSGGGGGGGGGLLPGGISDAVSDEMAKLQMIVGESLLAIGLILAMTGHIPLGVGLMAVGAAAIVKTIVNDWGKLSSDTQEEIATIMAACSVGFLALGFILAATGNIGLGIGMMVLGAANMAGLVAMGFNDMLSDEIRDKVTKILGIGGSLLFVAGLIIALAVPGARALGIGMMIAGGASLAATAAINWDSIGGKVMGVVGPIKEFVVNAYEAISKAVTDAWNSVKQWWEDSGIGPAVRAAWDNAKQWLITMWNVVKNKAVEAWGRVKEWWETSGIGQKISQAWDAAKQWMITTWNVIKNGAVEAWDKVRTWWTTSGIKDKISRAWDSAKQWLLTTWNVVKNGVVDAWGRAKEWWETSGISSKIESAWNDAKTWLVNTWETIKDNASKAFEKAKVWWETNVTANVKKEGAWGGVKGFFEGIWGDAETGSGIAGLASKAWNIVENWWKENVYSNIEKAWKGITEFFEGIFKPFKDAYDWLAGIFGWNNQTVSIGVAVHYSESGMAHGGSASHWSDVTDMWQGYTGIVTPASTVSTVTTDSTAINKVKRSVKARAAGAYDIPRGELFIANEAGAEMVGSINGKPSVANQQQIVEGISKGVYDANQEQNNLMRQQNELLRQLLEKEFNVNLGASAAFGRTVKQSLDAYSAQSGGC